MGLERPYKKQSSGLFLGRGRVPFFPNASLITVFCKTTHSYEGKEKVFWFFKRVKKAALYSCSKNNDSSGVLSGSGRFMYPVWTFSLFEAAWFWDSFPVYKIKKCGIIMVHTKCGTLGRQVPIIGAVACTVWDSSKRAFCTVFGFKCLSQKALYFFHFRQSYIRITLRIFVLPVEPIFLSTLTSSSKMVLSIAPSSSKSICGSSR